MTVQVAQPIAQAGATKRIGTATLSGIVVLFSFFRKAQPMLTLVGIGTALSSCSEPPPTQASTRQSEDIGGESRVEPAELFGGLLMSTTRAAMIDGKRPELSATCHQETGQFIHFELVRNASSPPPLRGNFATLKIDGDAPIKLEMSWGSGAGWMIRDASDVQERAIAISLAKAHTVTLDGIDEFAPTPVTWSIDLPQPDRTRFAKQCGA